MAVPSYGSYQPPYTLPKMGDTSTGAPAYDGQNMTYARGGATLGSPVTSSGIGEGAGRAWATGGPAPTPYDPWQAWGNGPGRGGTTDNPSVGTGSYGTPGTGAGVGPGGSTPYIGGAGDPNAARIGGGTSAAGGSNYGPYLGWDQAKLNDASHNTPKYQFLRAMLDAGISSQNRDLTGAVAALKARGYPVEAVPGSSDQIKWGDQGTYDIFNGTNGDFFFGEQGGGGAPPTTAPLPNGMGTAGNWQPSGSAVGGSDLGLGPWNSSSYSNPNSQQIANQQPGMFNRQPYTPPYLNGSV